MKRRELVIVQLEYSLILDFQVV